MIALMAGAKIQGVVIVVTTAGTPIGLLLALTAQSNGSGTPVGFLMLVTKAS